MHVLIFATTRNRTCFAPKRAVTRASDTSMCERFATLRRAKRFLWTISMSRVKEMCLLLRIAVIRARACCILQFFDPVKFVIEQQNSVQKIVRKRRRFQFSEIRICFDHFRDNVLSRSLLRCSAIAEFPRLVVGEHVLFLQFLFEDFESILTNAPPEFNK